MYQILPHVEFFSFENIGLIYFENLHPHQQLAVTPVTNMRATVTLSKNKF